MINQITLQDETANRIISIIESIRVWWKEMICRAEENYFLIN